MRNLRFGLLLLGAHGLCLAGCAGGASPVEPVSPAAAPSVSVLRSGLTRSAAGLHASKRPDGITRFDVVQGFQSASVVATAPDGRRAQRCVQSAEELERMLTQMAGGEP